MSTKNDFLNILKSLEDEVFGLIAGLEKSLGRVATVPTAPQPATSANPGSPKKPYNPFWKGLRGVGRWLWKGYSKDNPDYTHLYGDAPQKECWVPLIGKNRPSLQEYLEFSKTIDSFADEIFVEAFGKVVFEESTSEISALMQKFRIDFKNVIKKYIDIINKIPEKTTETKPEEKPSATEVPSKSDKTSSAASSEPEKTGASVAAAATSADAVDSTSSATVDKTTNVAASDSSVDTTSASNQTTSGEEPDSAKEEAKKKGSNYKKWVDDAISAKKNGTIGQPNETWLTNKGYISREKLPLVVAWVSMKSHKDITSDKDVEDILKSDNALGSKFRGLPNKNKDGKNTLIKNLRSWFPLASDEEFKKLLSELGVDEKIDLSPPKKEETPSKKTTKEKLENPSKAPKESEDSKGDTKDMSSKDLEDIVMGRKKDEIEKEPDRSEDTTEYDRTVSKLYENKNKQEIIEGIEKILIAPIFNMLEAKEDKKAIRRWWGNLKSHLTDNKEETIDSLLLRIKSGDLFDDIIDNTEVTKNKPDKTINKSTLLDLIRSAE